MLHAIISNGKRCIFISNFSYPSHVSLHFAASCVSGGLETILPGTVTYRAYLDSYRQLRGRWLVKNAFLFSLLCPKTILTYHCTSTRYASMRSEVSLRHEATACRAKTSRMEWGTHSKDEQILALMLFYPSNHKAERHTTY